MTSLTRFPHPVKTLVPRDLATRLWPADRSARLTRKYDGEFAVREVHGYTLLGELVRPKSGGLFTPADLALLAAHGEFFAAFDCVFARGCDISGLALKYRDINLIAGVAADVAAPLISFAASRPPIILAETVFNIADVFLKGGEGVCRNPWDSPYGAMDVCKAGEIYLCRVITAPGQFASAEVQIVKLESEPSSLLPPPSAALTRVPARSLPAGVTLKPGDLLRVEGMGLTAAGKIREPKLCREFRGTH